MGAREFSLQIDRELDEALEDLRERVVALGSLAIEALVQRTPFDTGKARANWTVSIGQTESRSFEVVDPTGQATITNGITVTQTFLAREDWPIIYYQNNVPYIGRLEDGYSQLQAPNGMLGLTYAELVALAE